MQTFSAWRAMMLADMEEKKPWKMKLGDIVLNIPGKVPKFTKTDIVRRVHGISWGDSCFNCGRVWEETDYPLNRCPGCSALVQRLCTTSGCEAVCYPVRSESPLGVSWYEAPSYCEGCTGSTVKTGMGDNLRNIFPQRLLKYAKSYVKIEARESLDRALEMWALTKRMGKDTDETVFLTYGSLASGKSVSLVRAGAVLYMKKAVGSVLYVEADDIFKAVGDRYADEHGVKHEARSLLKRAREVDLCIIDGIRNRQGVTAAQKAELSQVIHTRIRQLRPTVLAQDMDTPSLTWLDAHLNDTVDSMKWCVRCDCDARTFTGGR